MAKLPNQKRFLTEDFPSQKSWIGALLQSLNQFMESVVGSLDRGLTVADNMDAQMAQVTVTSTGSGVITEPASFKVTTRSRPTQLLVGKVEVVSGSAVTAAVFPTWEFVPASNTLKITSIAGLANSSKYKINLTVLTS